jgi:hypothetical protein
MASQHRYCRVALLTCTLLFVLLSSANTALAIPLSTYQERLRQASTALEALRPLSEEVYFEKERAAIVARTLKQVHTLLPPDEMVEWAGTSIKVDNGWLDEPLRAYERMAVIDDPQSVEALSRITERLRALDERLMEIRAGKQSEAGRKDEEKARLASILQREEYRKKTVEKGALADLWERFMKWLRNLFPQPKPLEPGQAKPISWIAQVIVVGLATALIAFVLWKFLPRLLRRDRRGKKRDKRRARVVLGEHLSPDQTASDLLAEAEALARAGQLRAAIRKGYIALLCELGDRKILSLAQHKTNRDYLRAVQERRILHSEMQQLTASFENHWYGFATATPEDWAAFRTRYYEALKQ